MDLHTLARSSGLVGGLCWLARYVLDRSGSGPADAGDALYWAGLVLLAVALVAAGAGLVSSSATWLRAIVGVALPLLVWSVLEVLHPAGDSETIDAAFGLAMALVSVAGLVRGRSHGEQRSRSAGTHAR
jgi:hydrogenase/urease accessory protein HupE